MCQLNFGKKRHLKYFLSFLLSYYNFSCYNILYNLIVLIFYCNHSYSYFGFDKVDISPSSSRCPSNFEKKGYNLKFLFFLFHFSKNIICFDFVHSNTYIGFHKIDSGPQRPTILMVAPYLF